MIARNHHVHITFSYRKIIFTRDEKTTTAKQNNMLFFIFYSAFALQLKSRKGLLFMYLFLFLRNVNVYDKLSNITGNQLRVPSMLSAIMNGI